MKEVFPMVVLIYNLMHTIVLYNKAKNSNMNLSFVYLVTTLYTVLDYEQYNDLSLLCTNTMYYKKIIYKNLKHKTKD